MDSFVKLLETYTGRDKVVRTACYLSLYFSGVTDGRISRAFKTISQDFSYCRLLLRLFDDLPMLQYSLSYGTGKEDGDILLRFLGVIGNITDQIYYPVEHIAWAADKKILNTKSGKWWTYGTVLWGLSLFINIARSIRVIIILQKQTRGLKDVSIHETIVKKQLEHLLAALKCGADLAIAGNFLPSGTLWAGKLSTSEIGLFGLFSSLLGAILFMKNIK